MHLVFLIPWKSNSFKTKDVDEFHNNCYKIILEIANKVSINETKAHTATFQKNRNNVPSESVSDCFKKIVTIPLIDHFFWLS